jgi:predicted nucleic acid-binding protein
LRKLFADTSALLALALRDDAPHAAAARFVRENSRMRFVLTDLVLSEMVTRLRARADAGLAAAAARRLLASTRYEIVFADPSLIEAGLEELERFADKQLSLTDAVAFVLIDRLSLDGAFTFDRDFRDCGYPTVP